MLQLAVILALGVWAFCGARSKWGKILASALFIPIALVAFVPPAFAPEPFHLWVSLLSTTLACAVYLYLGHDLRKRAMQAVLAEQGEPGSSAASSP